MTNNHDAETGNHAGWAERRFQALIESAADVIIILDASGRLTYGSPSVLGVLGYQPTSYLGVDVFDFIHPDDAARVRQSFARALGTPGIHARIEFRIRHADGSWHDVESATNVLFHEPSVRGTVVNIRDISDRKRAEREIDDLLIREQSARAEVEAALRTQEEILSVLSHDLATPLTAILMGVQFLQRCITRGAQLEPRIVGETLTALGTAGVRMTAMVAELRDLAKLRQGRQLELERQTTDLVVLAHQVIDELQQTAPHHQLMMDASVPSLMGEWDASRLERVIFNLLANAIKYSPEGGAIVTNVDHLQDGGRAWARLKVRDQGLGIPVDDLPHVFKQFHRGTNVEGRLPGTGIGLFGVQQIVEQHGGTVAVASEEGRGTTVTLCLPLM